MDYPGRLGRPGLRAVDGASFSIHPGEVLGLMGESGSGKTTIGRALAGLIPVSAGELHVPGEDLTARPRKHAHPGHIGYVFQDPATSFNPLLTVGESIAEPLTAHRHRRRSQAIRNRVESLLDAVHLPRTYANRYPHELSGGQRQRASLARALALRPGLLIADEPTSALDASVQAQVLDLFTELQRELGFAALFISHDRTVTERVADRVAILHRGKIAET